VGNINQSTGEESVYFRQFPASCNQRKLLIFTGLPQSDDSSGFEIDVIIECR
jgi:hypothetical protein